MWNLVKWKPIKTAPKNERILAKTSDGFIFITEYRNNGEVDGPSGFGVVDSCCGYYEDMNPTHWMRLIK